MRIETVVRRPGILVPGLALACFFVLAVGSVDAAPPNPKPKFSEAKDALSAFSLPAMA